MKREGRRLETPPPGNAPTPLVLLCRPLEMDRLRALMGDTLTNCLGALSLCSCLSVTTILRECRRVEVFLDTPDFWEEGVMRRYMEVRFLRWVMLGVVGTLWSSTERVLG